MPVQRKAPLLVLTSSLLMSLRAMVSLSTDWNMVISVPSLQQHTHKHVYHFFMPCQHVPAPLLASSVHNQV
jgi:hypothetical protein